MKTIKSIFLLVLFLCFTVNFSNAQKLFHIHEDVVKPSMVAEYEKVAKSFIEACKTHNPSTSWAVAVSSDYKYSWITPMENFAELDKKPFEAMSKTMGDAWANTFTEFNKCYNSHREYVMSLSESLSYMPEGSETAQTGFNNRKWYFVYYTPENEAKLWEAMKGVKDMFANKKSKLYYRVYRAGFGSPESYYLVSVSEKDEIEGAKAGLANQTVLGDERKAVFGNMMQYVSKFEELSGEMRPDLYYEAK